jgi:hypothetical protein
MAAAKLVPNEGRRPQLLGSITFSPKLWAGNIKFGAHSSHGAQDLLPGIWPWAGLGGGGG